MGRSDAPACPCGSGKTFSECCKLYFSMLGLSPEMPATQTLFFEWLETYSRPIVSSFLEKSRPYIFRISCYLDWIMDQFFPPEFNEFYADKEAVNKAVFSIKNNIVHSLLASFSCLAQGLFIQSGILLRSLIEDCLVLIDLSESRSQVDRFLKGKYSTSGLVPRVKTSLPPNIIEWYRYFSANFTHLGPLHPAPYLPRACYPDNYVLVAGLQNIVRATVTFHVVLERVYFDKTSLPLFWKRIEGDTGLVFDEDSPVFTWVEELGKEIVSRYPPGERKEGFFYDSQSYRTK